MNQAVATTGTDERRQLALLKAVGLDRASPEQRELALAIAKRYDLDLMLKHLVLVDGRPYVTRDALLHIAHRSGQLDGIEVTEPVLADGFWRATCSVYRRDMTRPFTYSGRYPEKGGNQKFAPEMATKVAESMALRRAFDISAPTQDERWDVVDVPAEAPPAPVSLAERAASRVAAIEPSTTSRPADSAAGGTRAEPEPANGPEQPGGPASASVAGEAGLVPDSPAADAVRCADVSPFDGEQCRQRDGHAGIHRGTDQTWPRS